MVQSSVYTPLKLRNFNYHFFCKKHFRKKNYDKQRGVQKRSLTSTLVLHTGGFTTGRLLLFAASVFSGEPVR